MILDEPSEETPESAKEHCETFFRNFFLRQSPNEHLNGSSLYGLNRRWRSSRMASGPWDRPKRRTGLSSAALILRQSSDWLGLIRYARRRIARRRYRLELVGKFDHRGELGS
jgi:hypothetical protein